MAATQKLVNIVYNHYLTVGMTFSHYTKSSFQAGSAQLARAKSYRVLARGQAQNILTLGNVRCTSHALA